MLRCILGFLSTFLLVPILMVLLLNSFPGSEFSLCVLAHGDGVVSHHLPTHYIAVS
jgi:hypothetical protein